MYPSLYSCTGQIRNVVQLAFSTLQGCFNSPKGLFDLLCFLYFSLAFYRMVIKLYLLCNDHLLTRHTLTVSV